MPLFCAAAPFRVEIVKETKSSVCDQLRQDLEAVERGVRGVVLHRSVVLDEADEARILHPARLVRSRGKDHPLGQLGVGGEGRDVARRGEDADDLGGLVPDGRGSAVLLEPRERTLRARRA